MLTFFGHLLPLIIKIQPWQNNLKNLYEVHKNTYWATVNRPGTNVYVVCTNKLKL